MVMKRFYSELGKLLYAFAASDNSITIEEKQKIFESVRKDLLPKEKHNDAFGENLVSYILAEFDFLDEQVADSKSSFESFIDYVRDHQSAITPELKAIISGIARKTALSGAGKREEERRMLNQLRSVLAAIRPLKRPRKTALPVRITVPAGRKLKSKSVSVSNRIKSQSNIKRE